MDKEETLNVLFNEFLQIDLNERDSLKKVISLLESLDFSLYPPSLEECAKKLKSAKTDSDLEEIGSLLEKVQSSMLEEKVSIDSENESPPSEEIELKKENLSTEDTNDYEKILSEDVDLLNTFFEETQENLDSIELQLLIWERNPNTDDCINEIFRPFHTIKGIAGFLDLNDLQLIAHRLEDLLSFAREKKLSYNKGMGDLIFKGTDYIKSMVDVLKDNFLNNMETL